MTTFKLSNTSLINEATQIKKVKKIEEDKPKRKRITPEQFCLLIESFQKTDTPSYDLREKLAKKLNMTNREVQVWFQNRRAKVNRIKLQEQEEFHLKTTKFNYWSSPTSSINSSLSSSPSLTNDLFMTSLTPIDLLANAAAYVQRWDEQQQQQQKRKLQDDIIHVQKKQKSWRPWL